MFFKRIKSLFNRVDIINLLTLFLNLIAALGLYFSLEYNGWAFFNIVFFIVWLWSSAVFANSILSKIFFWPKSYLKPLNFFLSIILLGFTANIFTSWLVFNNLSFLMSLMVTGLALFAWARQFKKIKSQEPAHLGKNEGLWNFSPWWLVVLFIIVASGFTLVILSQTGQYLTSPWQVLPLGYLGWVLAALVIVFSLVFSKNKVWLVLLAIILASFLMHSYLLVYSQGFGGDRWRHLGSEKRILDGLTYQPTLATSDIWYKNIAGLTVPRALMAGPKLSYGFEWSLALMTAKIFHSDIFVVDKYLVLILWSLFLPYLVFVLAWQIKGRSLYALLSSASTLGFYLLQYYGSQTLPISLSLLYFLFFIACLLAYLPKRQNVILAFLLFLLALSYFGYSLAFVILILALIWALALRLKQFKKYLVFSFLSLAIFIMEAVSGFSNLKTSFSLSEIINDAFVKGSFLFFERGHFLPLTIQYWPILSLIISLSLGCIWLINIYKMRREKKETHLFLIGLSLILLINYLLSWVFLDGLHTLARRMNVFMVLIWVFILAYGLANWSKNKTKAILVVVALSLIGVLTYASGPILEASVSSDDTLAMKYVWAGVTYQKQAYCVLADTWPLLALEAYSAKEIVAGNFPSDFNYQQPERVDLLNSFIKNPSRAIINEALKITQAKTCLIVLSYKHLNQEKIRQINSLLGQPKILGQNLVWRYDK